MTERLTEPATDQRDGWHRVAHGQDAEVSGSPPASDHGPDGRLVPPDTLPRRARLAERDHAFAPVDLLGLRTQGDPRKRRVEPPRSVDTTGIGEAEVRGDPNVHLDQIQLAVARVALRLARRDAVEPGVIQKRATHRHRVGHVRRLIE